MTDKSCISYALDHLWVLCCGCYVSAIVVLCLVGLPVTSMRHRQSLPNLSRSPKLSLATTPRSDEQQRGVSGRRASAQAAASGDSYKLQPKLKLQNQGVSRMIPSRQQVSPARDVKSPATREQSPSSTLLAGKTNSTPRQSSRLFTPGRLVLALSTS